MCEAVVYLEIGGKVQEMLKDVTRVVMHGNDAVCTNIIGERVVLEGVALKEANLLSHGLVFRQL